MKNHYLRNEFTRLETYVKEQARVPSAHLRAEDRELLIRECSRIRETIWNSILEFGQERERNATLIDYLLLRIIELVEAAEQISDDREVKPDEEILLKEDTPLTFLLKELHTLMAYIQANFKRVMNLEIKVPASYVLSIYRQQLPLITELHAELQDRKVNPLLMQIIQDYTLQPLVPKAYLMNDFSQVDYYVFFIQSLHAVDWENIDQAEEHLVRELIRLNFNAGPFIQYCVSKIRRDYQEVLDPLTEQKELTLKLRDYQQLPVMINYAYDGQTDSLKTILENAIKEELKCLKRIFKPIVEGEVNGTPHGPPSYYFKIELTLLQLLFFFQLMLEAGILICKHRTGIYQFIAAHIETSKHRKLSVGSMQRKYGHTDREGMKKVRASLLTMLHLVNNKHLRS